MSGEKHIEDERKIPIQKQKKNDVRRKHGECVIRNKKQFSNVEYNTKRVIDHTEM